MQAFISSRARTVVRLVAVLSAAVATCAHAQSHSIDLDIAAGATSQGLIELSRQLGVQIIFPYDAVSGRQSPAVHGHYSKEDALRILLEGTRLAVESDDGKMITLAVRASQPQAQAQGSDDAAQLGEIVVTARRREEKLASVPIAITALDQKAITENRIQSLYDLQRVTPSLSVFSAQNRDEQRLIIRGQGGNAPGAAPGISVYFNESPLPGGTNGNNISPGGGPGRFYDLENVQVLKGPQGTLFGRNSTGGALLIESRRPADHLEGYVQAIAGNYDDREYQGAVSVPLVAQKLLARFAFSTQKRDGFTKSLGTPSHPDGLDLDNRDVLGGRATFVFTPIDWLKNELVFDYLASTNNGTSVILRYLRPGSTPAIRYPQLAQVLRQQDALGIRTQVETGVDPFSDYHFANLTDILRVDLSDSIALRNLFGYTRSTAAKSFDGDGTVYPVISSPRYQPVADKIQQYSEELQLQGGAPGARTRWTAGLFFLDSPPQDFNNSDSESYGTLSILRTRTGERSKAVYGQLEHDLSGSLEGLRATAGYRYTWDHRFSQSQQKLANGTCRSRGGDADCVATGSTDSSAGTWTVGLDYQLAPGSMLYGTTRRGYRAGGFNISALDAANRRFDPEYVDDVELGLKSAWTVAGASVNTNVAVYTQNYKNIQVTRTVVESGTTVQVVSNAARARITGAEFEARAALTPNLELGANTAWINMAYLEFASDAVRTSLLASRYNNLPRVTYGLNARYRHALPKQLGGLELFANWSGSGDVKVGDGLPSTPYQVQKAFGLLNLTASWSNVLQKPLTASLFVTNALDREYVAGGYNIPTSFGTAALTYGEPRMFGVRMLYDFE